MQPKSMAFAVFPERFPSAIDKLSNSDTVNSLRAYIHKCQSSKQEARLTPLGHKFDKDTPKKIRHGDPVGRRESHSPSMDSIWNILSNPAERYNDYLARGLAGAITHVRKYAQKSVTSLNVAIALQVLYRS